MIRKTWGISALLVVLALSVRMAAQQPPDLYAQGLVQENAAGNLEQAITLFTRAAREAGTNRELAARALVRAAGCDEKLGRYAEAARLYADVMRAYPEQRAQVSLAQERVNLLRKHAAIDDAAKGPADARVPPSSAAVFGRYCVSCHRAAMTSGGLNLEAISDQPVIENTKSWEQVVRRLLARRDPPPGMSRPDEDTYRALTASVQRALDASYAANRTLHDAERVDDAGLATRLAALIWSGAPDAALLADAKLGRLHEPAVLRRQIVRMLRDQQSARLVDGFFAPWLSLDKLKKAKPDSVRFPDVDADLVQAMDTETRLFLGSQLREDRDAIEIWTADYTYLNARLARHYGVQGITGQNFRRVRWADDRRAGILGQGAILMALSNPSRTSPTSRGRFVLSRYFGVDAPSPPANVPALAEGAPNPGTMRDRMRAHRAAPSCASCHSLFDPFGLALENFDPTGAWRTTDGGAEIDASGTFVDGTRFDGPAGLRAALLKDRDAYYTNVTEQLLAYALHRKGTGGHVYDYEMAAVRKIVKDAARDGDRWSSLLTGIATSEPFQMRHLVP